MHEKNKSKALLSMVLELPFYKGIYNKNLMLLLHQNWQIKGYNYPKKYIDGLQIIFHCFRDYLMKKFVKINTYMKFNA